MVNVLLIFYVFFILRQRNTTHLTLCVAGAMRKPHHSSFLAIYKLKRINWARSGWRNGASGRERVFELMNSKLNIREGLRVNMKITQKFRSH